MVDQEGQTTAAAEDQSGLRALERMLERVRDGVVFLRVVKGQVRYVSPAKLSPAEWERVPQE